jgi:hypothetical protein
MTIPYRSVPLLLRAHAFYDINRPGPVELDTEAR